MTISYEPAYERENKKENPDVTRDVARKILKENAPTAFNYYLKSHPLLAYYIAKEHDLPDEKIAFAESKGEIFHAATIAQDNGMIKKALKYFKECNWPEMVNDIKEDLTPIKFSKNIEQKTKEIDLLTKVLKISYKSNNEVIDDVLRNFYYKN